MNATKLMVIAGCMLMLLAPFPLAAAHLAANSDNEGSDTSAGYGGPALDPDPCRWRGDPGSPVGELTGGLDCYNNGVSGVYVGAVTLAAVACDPLNPDVKQDDKLNCNSNFEVAGETVNYEPRDWGARVLSTCDAEINGGQVHTSERSCFSKGTSALCDAEFRTSPFNEDSIDDGPSDPAGLIPDGTFDDGGLGGACHVSGYRAGRPDGANTEPEDVNQDGVLDFPGDNSAETVCTGTVWAEDWLLGDDVPIAATCDSNNFTSTPLLERVANGVNCLLPPTDSGCVVDELLDFIDDALNEPSAGGLVECVPGARTSGVDTVVFGKGDGHAFGGVSVPGPIDPCTRGDVVVFVMNLVSANPFGHNVGKGGGPLFYGAANGHGADDWSSEDNFDDQIVYVPVAGWIDHYYDLEHTNHKGGNDADIAVVVSNPDGNCDQDGKTSITATLFGGNAGDSVTIESFCAGGPTGASVTVDRPSLNTDADDGTYPNSGVFRCIGTSIADVAPFGNIRVSATCPDP